MSDFANMDGFHEKVGSGIMRHVVSNWIEYEAFVLGDSSYTVPINKKTGLGSSNCVSEGEVEQRAFV